MMSLFQMKYNTQNFADRFEVYLTQDSILTLHPDSMPHI